MCQSSSLMEACYVRGLATHDHIDLSSQLPFKAPFLSSVVMQLSGVLELLIERLVLEVSVLNEVSPQLDFYSSSLTRDMSSAAALSVSKTVYFSYYDKRQS